MTYNITISTFLVIIGSLLGIAKLKKFQNKIQLNIVSFAVTTVIITIAVLNNNPNLFNIISIILLAIYLSSLSQSDFKILIKILIWGAIVQSVIAIWQFGFQESTNLGLLKYLGEPNLNLQFSKGISHIEGILRGYGTTNHPNFLAGLIFSSILLAQLSHLNSKIAFLSLSLLSSLSISGIASSLLLYIKKTKVIAIGFIVVISVGLFKLNASNYTGIQDRIQELINFKFQFKNINSFLFGSGNFELGTSNFKLLPWEITPIHNHFLEISRQFGIFGLTTAIIISKRIWNNSRFSFIALIPIIILDHYFITLANGMILFTFIYFGIEKFGISSQKV